LAYKKGVMSREWFSLFLVLNLALAGCAPDSTKGTPDSPGAQPLPERPSQQNEIFNRELLYKDDPRISYCEILDTQKSSYSGMRDLSLQPLASLSKVITTAWALEKLGADFRFQSEIYLQALSETGVYDVYLKTNLDPVINIEKLLYFISQMNARGVRQIRNLVIDENTRVFLGVLSNPHIELENTPISMGESIDNLQLIFNSKNWAEKTKVAKANLLDWAAKTGKTVSLPEKFAVTNVLYRKAKEISLQDYSDKLVVPSAPLFKYIKNINVNSNNYLADALFSYLGGVSSFKEFQKKQLSLAEKDLQIFTGSGLSDSSKGFRQDNLGTCFSVIKVLGFFKNKADQAQLNLGSLLLNPSVDEDGTFDVDTSYQNAVVLKTGRLYEVAALNLAGFVSTSKGVLSFVFLGHDFTEEEAHDIENDRRRMLQDIYSQFPVRSDFNTVDYSPIFL